MTTIRRAAILKLASAAYEMDLSVANGVIAQDEEGRWHIGQQSLDSWLSEHEGEESVLVGGIILKSNVHTAGAAASGCEVRHDRSTFPSRFTKHCFGSSN